MKRVTTIVQGEKEVSIEVIANSVKAISDGIRKLRGGPLNDRALILLIQHAAPNHGGRYGNSTLTQKEVRAVLEGIEALEKTYLKTSKKN